MRVGWGYDAHALGGEPPLLLAGVTVDTHRGVKAISDGDVAAHAVADALLGAAALGDLGEWFPDSDSRWKNADSMAMLESVVATATRAGFEPSSLDVTVVAETPRVAPHRQAMRKALAEVLGVPLDTVSVKATSTDGLGFIGREEGIAVVAVVAGDF